VPVLSRDDIAAAAELILTKLKLGST